tara:strand:- start:3237 stop:4010 length:774 start_codon:yes stop_codon:yes gene_type:complete
MSKISVIEFLKKCIEYADASITRKEKRGDDSEIIAEWHAYRNYTQYALEEVEKGDLDHWFVRDYTPAEHEINVDDLDHPTRAKWLAASASPRPLVLVSTRSGNQENVAPVTSISVVSNSPPLIVMSLSQNREGRKRDTYLNLVDTKECELQFLAPTLKAARDADLAGKATEGSEWDLLDVEGPIHPLAIVVMKCRLVEDNPLPEGAVARLLTLRVESLIVPSETPPDEGLALLCQHGMDRLIPTPVDWSHIATYHRS